MHWHHPLCQALQPGACPFLPLIRLKGTQRAAEGNGSFSILTGSSGSLPVFCGPQHCPLCQALLAAQIRGCRVEFWRALQGNLRSLICKRSPLPGELPCQGSAAWHKDVVACHTLAGATCAKLCTWHRSACPGTVYRHQPSQIHTAAGAGCPAICWQASACLS